MEKKTVGKKGLSAKTAIGIGAGVAALTAAAYVLFGPEGKKKETDQCENENGDADAEPENEAAEVLTFHDLVMFEARN